MDNLAFIHQKAVERASDDDRAWFEANPDRHLRLRDVIPLEFNGPLPAVPAGYTHRTITVQIKEGVRSRVAIGLREEVPNEVATDSDIDRLLYEYGPPGAYEWMRDAIIALQRQGAAK